MPCPTFRRAVSLWFTQPAWRTWLGLALVLLLGHQAGYGAQPYQPVGTDPLLEPWRWRTFPDLSGLDAQCMAEAADGTIWFGTADGITSYDGFDWRRQLATSNGIIGGWVTALCSGTDGTLYAGGWWGISQFSRGQWTRLIPAPGIRFADVRRLATAPDGTVWAATSWGALQRRPDVWTLHTDPATAARLRQDPRYQNLLIELLPESLLARPRTGSLASNRIDLTEVRADAQGRLWFGTKTGEILCHAPATAAAPGPGTWTLYNEADGLPGGRAPAILPLQDGTLWVVAAPAGQAAVFDGRVWRTLPLPAPGVAPDGARLLQTRDGVVWVSARYVLYAWRHGEWRTYAQPEVPVPTALNLLTQSADGALWITGPNTDIQRVEYQTPRWTTLEDLNFHWESPAGARWFLHRSGRVVLHEAGRWTSYGPEDGLIDTPVALVGTRNGEVWVAGSHGATAATARFAGGRWTRQVHAAFSWGIDHRGVFESSDGSLWFGAAVDSSGPKEHRDGILRFRDGGWTHHHQPGRSPRADGAEDPATLLPPNHRPEPIEKYSSLGESRDGKIWAGRNVLVFHDGRKWTEFFPPPGLGLGIIEAMFTTRAGVLWVGSRQYGALRHDGSGWQQFQGRDSLTANSVRSITETTDGSLWVATDHDVSRFDGRTWTPGALPALLNLPHDGGNLKAAPDGALWINRHTIDWNQRAWSKAARPAPASPFRTVRHEFRGPPPQTTLSPVPEKISQPGNLSVLWSGASPWREPRDSRFQFSYRLDDRPWSAYTSDGGHAFFALPPGRHRLEVRARDQEFNADPTPAAQEFVVLPPVWRQPWFILLMILLGAAIATQSCRVFLERGRLRRTNRALAGEIAARRKTNEEIRQLNATLEQRVADRTAQLAVTNRELESFSYSVSHDLRAPLRGIDGFSRALLEDYADRLDDNGRDFLNRIRAASQRMGHLIDALLQLSRVSRDEMRTAPVDLSALAGTVAAELRQAFPGRSLEFVIAPGLTARGDARLLELMLENLFGNAVKFTARHPAARIEFGRAERAGAPAFFVRDNGAGFAADAAPKLFGAFQRFHTTAEFPGTGIGLATVQRIIHRHGGRIEAESRPDHGATFWFTLPETPPRP